MTRAVLLNTPLPGVSYFRFVYPGLQFLVGFPFLGVTWKPVKRLKLDFRGFPPIFFELEASYTLSETLDVILGTSVYLVGIALIGVALGFLLRSTAAGIATLVGGVFIGPNLLNLLPESITDVFMKYLPNFAGDAMMTQVADPDLLSTGAAYGVFAAWVIGLLVLAGVMVRRRDA